MAVAYFCYVLCAHGEKMALTISMSKQITCTDPSHTCRNCSSPFKDKPCTDPYSSESSPHSPSLSLSPFLSLSVIVLGTQNH